MKMKMTVAATALVISTTAAFAQAGGSDGGAAQAERIYPADSKSSTYVDAGRAVRPAARLRNVRQNVQRHHSRDAHQMREKVIRLPF